MIKTLSSAYYESHCNKRLTCVFGYPQFQWKFNFVVQLLLELGIAEVTENLPRQVGGSYLALSRKKYSSCVVERCLRKAGEEQASWIILELLTSPNVCELLVDPFGNFVIQTALEVSQLLAAGQGDIKLSMIKSGIEILGLLLFRVISCEIFRKVKDYSFIMKGFVYEGGNPQGFVQFSPTECSCYALQSFREKGPGTLQRFEAAA
ncbi:hypothetical protein C3L33_10875, partial [Rhododendron williamsianum]